MKTDLDALMLEKGLDAILITGPAQHNPGMVYMTGGGHVSSADLIKKRGEEPVLFFNPMERDEAAKSGLKTKNLMDYNFTELLKQSDGDYQRAIAKRYLLMLTELGIDSGKLALYGRSEIGINYAIFSALQREMPGLNLVGEINNSVLMLARMTKDAAEIERIRKMGKITTQVVAEVADYITSQAVRDGIMVKSNGESLTIGDVKKRINLWLSERGAENPEDTIFAIGRDAGVPHSSGNPSDPLKLGQTIVFDIYPWEAVVDISMILHVPGALVMLQTKFCRYMRLYYQHITKSPVSSSLENPSKTTRIWYANCFLHKVIQPSGRIPKHNRVMSIA